MTRVSMGLAVVGALLLTPWAAAAAEPEFTSSRDGKRATMTLKTGGLTVIQTLSPAVLHFEVARAGDRVRVTGDLDGRVTVERAGTRRVVSMRGDQDGRRAIHALVSDSSALAEFEALMQSPWARSSRDAVFFVSTREWLRVVQGESFDIAQMLATAAPAATPAGIRLIGQRSPAQCWDTYAQDVVKFTYDLQACLSQAAANWWNPLHTAWCAYEYNLKSSLSAFWLLDCYRVPT